MKIFVSELLKEVRLRKRRALISSFLVLTSNISSFPDIWRWDWGRTWWEAEYLDEKEAEGEYELEDLKDNKSQELESDEDNSQSILSGISKRCINRNKLKVAHANAI